MNAKTHEKNQDANSAEEDVMTGLRNAVRNLRKDVKTKDEYREIKHQLLQELGYEKDSDEIKAISDEEFEALLIRAVVECFGRGLYSDIVLMSIGLLNGYYHYKEPKIEGRRYKFLEDSNYLRNYPISKAAIQKTILDIQNDLPEVSTSEYTTEVNNITDFLDLNKEGKESSSNKLKAIELELIDIFSVFLSKKDIKQYIKEDNKYLKKDEETGALLTLRLVNPSYPQPNYERLIWLELKKSNRKLQPLRSMTEMMGKGLKMIGKNKDKLAIVLVGSFALFLLVNIFPSSEQTSIDNPLTSYSMTVAKPIESYRKDGDGKQINNTLQETPDEDEEYQMQTVKKSF